MSVLFSELILLNINPALATTSYYRWQDTQGNWHFSDQPPLSAASDAKFSKVVGQTINTSTPTIEPHDPITNSNGTNKLKHRTRSERHKTDDQQKNIATKRQLKNEFKQKQLCLTLREKLNTIHTKLRAGYKEPKGNQLRKQRRKISNKIYRQC